MAERQPQTEAQRAASEANLLKGRETRRENERLRREGLLPPLERAPSRAHTHARSSTKKAAPKPIEQAPLRGPSKLTAVEQRNVKSGLVVAIAGADLAAARLVPTLWTPEDRLQQDETTLLVKAIYAELETWPKVLKWIAAAAEHGVHLQLAMALGSVAMPRLMRRGLVPLDVAVVFLAATQSAAESGDTVPVETGPAHVSDRDERNGQVNASGVPDWSTSVHGGFPQ